MEVKREGKDGRFDLDVILAFRSGTFRTFVDYQIRQINQSENVIPKALTLIGRIKQNQDNDCDL